MSGELPLGRELLATTGEIRVNVKSVKQTSKHTIALTFDHEGKQYQDRFDGDEQEISKLELEAAGKDVWATIKPDTSDKGFDPEIVSVEVVGND